MNTDHAWREIRGSDSEKVLLAAEEAGGSLTHDQAVRVLGDEWASHLATARLRELRLTSADEDYDEFRLSEAGRRLAQQVIQSRRNGPERWNVVQKAVLKFVEETSPDRVLDIVGTQYGLVEGTLASEREVERATAFLLQHGLLQTVQVDIADDLRPSLTVNGTYALHEPNIREYVERGFMSISNDYSTNTNVSGGAVGAVTGGTGNATSIHQSITRGERSQTLALVEKVLSGLGDADEDSLLRAVIESIKADAEVPSPSKGGILAKARDALLMAAATEGGRSVIQWIAEIITALGG